MEKETKEELIRALSMLQDAGDKIEDSKLRYKIDDFISEIKKEVAKS